ncbi:hypothetical protein LN650_10315 [Klebsiella pneumoniae subsp. pneumoniae]|nr:hypothetical protein [Klebsiella pneumoniae subsp. pneumoniae]
MPGRQPLPCALQPLAFRRGAGAERRYHFRSGSYAENAAFNPTLPPLQGALNLPEPQRL